MKNKGKQVSFELNRVVGGYTHAGNADRAGGGKTVKYDKRQTKCKNDASKTEASQPRPKKEEARREGKINSRHPLPAHSPSKQHATKGKGKNPSQTPASAAISSSSKKEKRSKGETKFLEATAVSADFSPPQPRRAQPTAQLPPDFDAFTLPEAFDLSYGHPVKGKVLDTCSTSIQIARRLRQLCNTVEEIYRTSTDRTELEKAAIIRDSEIADLALLLVEQDQIERCVNVERAACMHACSKVPPQKEGESDEALAARKKAAAELALPRFFQGARQIWNARYTRYKSKTLVFPAEGAEYGYVILQIAPNSVTDYLSGAEPELVIVGDPAILIS
jgi:hypothetical protein